MALWYVRSGAAGTGTGADWTNAKTTLAAAFSAAAAGDTIFVSEDHAETQASAMTLTSPGTVTAPVLMLCVNHAGSVPPVSADLRTTATVATTSGSAMSFSGYGYVNGVTFSCGSGGTSQAISFTPTTAWGWTFENCALKVGGTAAAAINVGGSSGSVNDGLLWLKNTVIGFAGTTNTMTVHARMRWENTASAIAGASLPTTLFSATANASGSQVELIGVDLSAYGTGKNLISVAGTAPWNTFLLLDCKLGASVSITTGSVGGPGLAQVTVINCDSDNTNYRYYRQTYQATEQQETTIVRTGGASDGTTSVSRKIVTTANASFVSPYQSEWIEQWSDTAGAHTVTVAIVNDGTTFNNNDVWLEVESLGTASFPLGTFANDAPSDVLAAGSAQTTDSGSTWTTTGLTTPIKQMLSVSITTQSKGIIRARVCVRKASATLYYDPLLQIT